jgi:lysozyme
MQTNQAGLDLIKSFEGCKLDSYQDVVGIWTIGYGSTGPDIQGPMSWTQEQADERLAHDLQKFETGVSSHVTSQLTSNQFSALVCFSYNVGLGNLESSTLLKDVNAGNFADAAAQFLRWNKAGGNVVAGLTRRRQAESDLFSKPDSSQDQLPAGPTDADINDQLSSTENN